MNNIKIIHTADWHLGQRFCDLDRREEHHHFLDWLLQTLATEQPKILLISGDIFDSSNPPHYAFEMYYNFLVAAGKLCPHIIVTGGNHDSPAALNAPRQLLKSLGIHVVGSSPKNLEDEIVLVFDDAGNPIAAIAAVPFLREGDVRRTEAAESVTDRWLLTKDGIARHYADLRDLLLPYKAQQVPLIATGHLYAAGADFSGSDKEMRHMVGHQFQAEATIFPPEFDYIALGHIHKPQIVAQKNHVRYSGSPIPLSFSERTDTKQVLSVTFEQGQLAQITPLPIPLHRALLRFKGPLERVMAELSSYEHSPDLPAHWVEVVVEADKFLPDTDKRVREAAENKNIVVLSVKNDYTNYRAQSLSQQVQPTESLDELSEIDVFLKRCESLKKSAEETEILKDTFEELMQIMLEKESK